MCRSSSCFAQPGFRRERRVTPPLRATWARRFECHATVRLNPARPAGALGDWVFRDPSGSTNEPLPSSGATPGGARFTARKRQRSETLVGLSQPTAQRVRTRVALAATSEPALSGKNVTGRAPIEIGRR
jgi:hypothetical protein